ncbi:MAG: endopeptidase La [Bacteroidales bacterium]|nr:endopeptidase La [Bacteroidales bacterium]
MNDILNHYRLEANTPQQVIPLYTPVDEDGEGELSADATFPLLPIRGNVLFPGCIMPISVRRKTSVQLIRDMERSRGTFIVVAQKEDTAEQPTLEDLYSVGSLARILRVLELPDGSITVILQGRVRMRLDELVAKEPYLQVKAHRRVDEQIAPDKQGEFSAVLSTIKEAAQKIIRVQASAPVELAQAVRDVQGQSLTVNFVAANSPISVGEKQSVLDTDNLYDRSMLLLSALNQQLQYVELKMRIQSKVKGDIDQQQKEFFLQKEMRAIQDELGGNPNDKRIAEYQTRAEKKKWPDAVRETFNKEVEILQRINPGNPEYSMQINYVETILDLPWNEYTEDNFDIQAAEDRLNADHYGLDKVKERILEHLAVLKQKGDMKSPILCLYGPPGVGKTSLGKSIAEALGRKYIRISLGGLHDESEIRGHRKTYIGAMLGRVLQGIKKAGTSNPVFMLDEIDKVTSASHGDPASALLEVLDPEQNSTFHDNYLDIDYDLSKVMFIATANNVNQISAPLLDRMELIEVTGYVQQEKCEIAERHLLPRQVTEHGLKTEDVQIPADVLSHIISHYTRESGVRQLNKVLATVCRKRALQKAKGADTSNFPISLPEVKDMLGVERYNDDMWQDDMKPGVVTGLAWTAVGGQILFVETSATIGKGSKLTLTGQLGDVMKESAVLALEYVHSHASTWNISSWDFDNLNVHIHVPEGAIPKDGPSAGITMVTAIVSALSGAPVHKRLAMTGEITLRGKVLPVGGIKEKILAAKRAGITDIVMCFENKRDVDEIKVDYIRGLNFHYVHTIEEVIQEAINFNK